MPDHHQSWASRDQKGVSPEELRELALFGALGEDTLQYLSRVLKVSHIEVGETVFREGEPPTEVFVLLDGEMEVLRRNKSGHPHRIAMLGPGNMFGEMSVIDIQARSASVRALAPSHVLCVSTEDLNALYKQDLKAYALVVLNIARNLSRRLRMAEGVLADLSVRLPDGYR